MQDPCNFKDELREKRFEAAGCDSHIVHSFNLLERKRKKHFGEHSENKLEGELCLRVILSSEQVDRTTALICSGDPYKLPICRNYSLLMCFCRFYQLKCSTKGQ